MLEKKINILIDSNASPLVILGCIPMCTIYFEQQNDAKNFANKIYEYYEIKGMNGKEKVVKTETANYSIFLTLQQQQVLLNKLSPPQLRDDGKTDHIERLKKYEDWFASQKYPMDPSPIQKTEIKLLQLDFLEILEDALNTTSGLRKELYEIADNSQLMKFYSDESIEKLLEKYPLQLPNKLGQRVYPFAN